MKLASLILLALLALLVPGRTADAAIPVSADVDPRPDVVFVLMDDFSLELLATMPEAQRLKADGALYENAFVIDSLCCPSRASILTGRAPHQTHVLTNTPNSRRGPIGGFPAFARHHNLERSFNVRLHRTGYTTGFIGKYMNLYEARTRNGVLRPPPKVPGWTSWQAILGGGYNGWGFQSTRLDSKGHVVLESHPRPALTSPRIDHAYATNVAADKAVRFIKRHRDDADPYFLEVAVYGPHSQMAAAYPHQPQFPSAMADRAPAGHPKGGNCGLKACRDLAITDLLGYDDPRWNNRPTYLHADGSTTRAPAWRTNKITLTRGQALARYRDRARMVQSIDRMLARIRHVIGPDTYLVLTADNGFHLGQHQLNGGKGAPYDSDSRVPLIVVGPDVVAGPRQQFVNNIDLAPTFEVLAGLKPARFRSGIPFAKTFARPEAATARYAFFEHTYAKSVPGEVDLDMGSGGTIDIIPSFIAIRGDRGLLVRFDLDKSWTGTSYAWELYRYDRPLEDVNVFATDHAEPWARDLMRRLQRWDGCTPAQCRAAAR